MRLHARHREVLRLAVPAFATLVAEPLFLLADSAIVGHLGPLELAGLGIAGAVLTAVVGLAVFLAYGTTAVVARQLGAGRRSAALALGVDGLWLAVLLGIAVGAVCHAFATEIVSALGASAQVTPPAVAYLRASVFGLPGMLVVLAATGVLRGVQDTRTPLFVAVAGAGLNALLNLLLVYPAGLGIAGSGYGTSLTQLLMGVVLAARVLRAASNEGASWRPRPAGIRDAALAGIPLVVRSAAMRVALLVTTSAAAVMGDSQLAAHQVVFTVWTVSQFALDALAIAAQALTGRDLGAGLVPQVRSTTRFMIRWGVGFGALLTLVLVAISPWLGRAFTSDPAVLAAIRSAVLPAALGLPVAGYVFVVDGVLIGAGDGRYLGVVSVINTLVYVVPAGLLLAIGPRGTTGLVWLWIAFVVVWMGARALTLWWRERGTRWLVVGV